MTLLEKIIANHSGKTAVKAGDFVDIFIDVRAARDFGGANVVKNLKESGLEVKDPSRTFFTFDCNPTGSDQKYAENQQICRMYARERGIAVYDIDRGIGTHLVIEKGLAIPGGTIVSTDSHANILGAIGAFGQGMGDQDIAAAWAHGSVWFVVPESVKITFTGQRPEHLSAKDIVLNLLHHFGANKLLGYSVELCGEEIDKLTLDERITIASMATEMGAIILMFTPNDEVLEYCSQRAGRTIEKVTADANAVYAHEFTLDMGDFVPMVSRPGHPEDAVSVDSERKTKIDSAFIGSCTNGRIEDMRVAAGILKGKKVAPGVVLKIVPTTDSVWRQCLEEGLIQVFKDAGALVGNAGCAGCAAGQIGQNGPGEVTVSTGNRNFAGKQGKGKMYLASPATVAASAVAGYLTTPDAIPSEPAVFTPAKTEAVVAKAAEEAPKERPTVVEGRVWIIGKDNIDTDMIYHNRYLTITDIREMGKYTFDNLAGWEDFAKRAEPGDLVLTGKNFGAGSSRQQAVDCFLSLGVQAVLAESFGAIYERNAINAAFPILRYQDISGLELADHDRIRVDFLNGVVTNLKNGKTVNITPFYEVQTAIYRRGGLLKAEV
jgi:homoaconitate hydratase family protein/3-isopropylmalate dehydratase small subunit